jgi:flagellar biosynthesis protein FlhA
VTPFVGTDSTLRVAVLEHRLEELVGKSLRAGRESGIGQEIEADTATHLRQAAEQAVRAMKARGRKPVLVIQGGLRRAVARIIGAIIPVIALEEIPESMPLQVVHTAGPRQSDG